MAIRKINSRSIAADVITAEDIAANAITVAEIQDGAVTPAKMHSTLDLSGKTMTLPAASVTAHVTQYDDTNVRNDIAVLNFQRAIDNNMGGYTSGRSFIDQFENENNIETQTNVSRVGERFLTTQPTYGLVIDRYRFYVSYQVYANWKLQGSQDNSSWTDISGATANATAVGSGWADSGTFANTTAYKYYRWYKTDGAQGGGYHNELELYNDGSLITSFANNSYWTASGLISFNPATINDGSTSGTAFHTDTSGAGSWLKLSVPNNLLAAGSTTGSLISTDISSGTSVSSMGIVVLIKNTNGTATLNTDVVAKVSADGGSNYTTATLTQHSSMSDGTIVAIANGESVTSGSTLKYQIDLANQDAAGTTKTTEISGVSLLW